MPRAKTKPITGKAASNEIENNAQALNETTPELKIIPIGQLETSPTNPRKRFPEASILELAGSIREKGVLEPLIVRRIADRKNGDSAYEIVCGERRYRASWDIGSFERLETLPCLVRTLTDEEVLDIQIHENLHREDVHPMDEALGYKSLMDTLGCDVAEVAARVGKSEGYVLNRLKLNLLIPEAQEDIEAGYLPIGHALELAKFAPESQAEILNKGVYGHKWGSEQVDKLQTKSLGDFREWIAEKILWRLAKAPFDRKATNLRDDGLACVKCPDRTGANAALFDEAITNNTDSCLNPVCWQQKAKTHVQITRERLAHEACVEVKDIPLVDTESWRDTEDVLGYERFVQIVDKKKIESWNTRESNKKCKASISTIDVSNKRYGKVIEVCIKGSSCKVHGMGTAADPEAVEKTRQERLSRKEEIFDIRVAELVRWRVMRLAADTFVKKAIIDGAGTGFLPRLVAKIWVNSNNGEASHTRGRVNSIMSEIMDVPQGHFGIRNWDLEDATHNASKLSETNLKLTLFFLVHGEKGHTYFDRMSPQTAVRELADEYGLNYDLMDAQARVEIAEEKAKKHVPLFKEYLAAVEAGKKSAKIPRPYAESYKAPA